MKYFHIPSPGSCYTSSNLRPGLKETPATKNKGITKSKVGKAVVSVGGVFFRKVKKSS